MIRIDDILARFPNRACDSHKGDYGHVLVIAGSTGYTGAAFLTSQAAALSGSGLVTLATGKTIYPILASKLTEVMVRPFIETKDGSISLMAEKDIAAFSENCSSLAIGPGVSRNKESQALVRNLIAKIDKPMVIDADGINALAGHVAHLKKARAPVVLTPHPGEFGRLIEKDVSLVQQDRKGLALAFANEYNTILVLKGHGTIVAAPGGECFVNATGNAGMASGGMGDVLTGMIAGFIAQGVSPFDASVAAVHLHGLAGDSAAKEKGMMSLLATDLLEKLPEILKPLC